MLRRFIPKLSVSQSTSLSADRSNFKSRLTLAPHDKGIFKCWADTIPVATHITAVLPPQRSLDRVLYIFQQRSTCDRQ